MSPTPASRSQLAPLPGHPTLANLRDQMVADEGLTLRKRQDISSALRTLAKALRRPLEECPAHPGYLRERLKGFAPAMAGLEELRWRNVMSLVRFALKQAGLAHVPGRYREPMTPEWAELFCQLEGPRTRHAWSRFARYCSVGGIGPEQVSDGVMNKFITDLENDSLIERPRSIHRTACLVWNAARVDIPAWPKEQLTVPDYRDFYVLPWTTFPPSLKTELDAYLARLGDKDPLAEHDFRPLRATSIATRLRQIREFISAPSTAATTPRP